MLDYTIRRYHHMIDPRIKALAQEASSKIKAVARDRDNRIQEIYQQYQQQAASIRAQVIREDLRRPTDDLSSEPHPHQQST